MLQIYKFFGILYGNQSGITKFALQKYCRDVAQPGSVLAWGARGRRFKSCHPDSVLPN